MQMEFPQEKVIFLWNFESLVSIVFNFYQPCPRTGTAKWISIRTPLERKARTARGLSAMEDDTEEQTQNDTHSSVSSS